MVNEANLIAGELKRKVKFGVKMVRNMPEFGTIAESKTDLMIRVDNDEDKFYYQWPAGKFTDRMEMIRELLNNFFENGELPDFNDKSQDPFWDPPEPLLVGSSYLQLKNLTVTLENELDAQILSSEGSNAVRGKLKIAYWPCDREGEGEPDDELLVEEKEELLGKELFFRVEIAEASDLPKELCKDVFVTYQFKHEPGQIYETPKVEGMTQNPGWNYKRVHTVDCATEYILNYFDEGQVSVCSANRADRVQGVCVPRLQDQPD